MSDKYNFYKLFNNYYQNFNDYKNIVINYKNNLISNPNKFVKDESVKILWFIMKLFSIFKFHMFQCYNIASYKFAVYTNNDKIVKFIKDSNIIKEIQYNNLDLYKENIDYDFILIDINHQYKKDSIRCNNIDDINIVNKYEYTPYKFISVAIKQDNNSYHIDLTQFYIIKNIVLDKDFIAWYMRINHNTNLMEDYSVIIIDNNVNQIILEKNQYIKFDNTNYNIIN